MGPHTDTEQRDELELKQFYSDVAAADLQPLWTQKSALLTPVPRVASLPWLWSGDVLRPLAAEAGRLIGIDRGGDRRVLALANPGLGGLPYTTRTLWGAVQYLCGHESAPAHRHSPGAIRFVLEGEGVWTLVNGDACSMAAGDLVLTPGWNWHEHHNPNDAPMMWFDGLDLPMVEYLDAVFFEDGDDRPNENRPVPPKSVSEHLYGHAGLRAEGVVHSDRHSPLLAYRWADTDDALTQLLAARPADASAAVTFVDPATGADALPTVRCQMLRLRPAARTPTTRTVGSSIVVCFRGSGTTVVNGVSYSWKAGDIMALPSWHAVDHQAAEPSDLFVFSDAPIIEAMRLARTEILPVAQGVTGTFAPSS